MKNNIFQMLPNVSSSKSHSGKIFQLLPSTFYTVQAKTYNNVFQILPSTLNQKQKTIQRIATTYIADLSGRPIYASAVIRPTDLGTGTPASVASGNVTGHMGNNHPYHHERGHLIGKQLGGNGADVRNLVGLSDGTNAPMMADIEGVVREILENNGANASIFLEVTVDYTGTHYNGPPAAPYVPGMVGSIEVNVYNEPGGAMLYTQRYPNGMVKNHRVLGCC
ncbi:DNA/RNA non-specific endonuclease [Candidatus Uabimicrobium amorphum]|uniref:Type VII secretion system protein EssD-like domain-containing protein n=1 Tax=Uabimicrobium amorphum TaxID=2596890 RepID=A0A5S9IR91_UABAM|nr:DNA/RNA non-specific endonuclease [Candidatus Uabimicrobium amorphum]BBM86658.1 hypothetical protein UABAM_05044 [Candidatus Uabimicrobium amorphum]